MKTCLDVIFVAAARLGRTLPHLAQRALLIGLACWSPLQAGSGPEGLNAEDWASIREAYEAGRHDFHERGDGVWWARNPGQGWTMTFDGRGFVARPEDGGWEWGLELRAASSSSSYSSSKGGESETSQRLAPRAEANRLSIQHTPNLEEWFVNDARGLEQGWTVKERPRGVQGVLRLELGVRGKLSARGEGGSVAFEDETGQVVLNYGGLKAWDANGTVLPTRMRGDSAVVAIEVEEAGAVYPVTIDPVAQQAYLKASNTGRDDGFGWSVAISGNTVVVGAPWESSNATGVNGNGNNNSAFEAGAAYVFVRSGSVWKQQAYLKASNAGEEDAFGRAVAISGDTIVVGAYLEDSNATGVDGNGADNSFNNAGAAYVFVRTDGVWSQQAYLKPSNTGAGDWFGFTVAVEGDTVAVGAIGESSNATGINAGPAAEANNSAIDAGAAYVFVRSGATWSQQAYLKASNTGANDWFGQSVAISGDTVVVGANGEDSNATDVNGNESNNSVSDAGAAYVFVRSGVTWSQQAYLKASNAGAHDGFGRSVAISGDTAVVGAPWENSNATGVNGNGADNSV